MKTPRLLFVLLGCLLAAGAAACGGGGSSVPAGVVAVVDGTQIRQSALDELIQRQKAVYAAQKREFPTEGSKTYENIQTNYVVYLVQQAEFQQQAVKLGVTVSQKDVDDALAAFKKANGLENPTKFRQYLKAQGYTAATLEKTLRASVLTQKLLAAATKNVKVDDQEVLAYYRQNRSKYAGSSFAQVKRTIHGTLLAQRRAEAKLAWIQNLPNRYRGKVTYGKGFKPPGS
jgi:hypothetical protein